MTAERFWAPAVGVTGDSMASATRKDAAATAHAVGGNASIESPVTSTLAEEISELSRRVTRTYGNFDKGWNAAVEACLAIVEKRGYEQANAVALGSRKSARKAVSSAANGRKGGRPKKVRT